MSKSLSPYLNNCWFINLALKLASLGGEDSAPDPYDLYDASLASCKAITLLMYAKRKQMRLESVDVEIERDNSREAKGVYVLNVSLNLMAS